MFYYLDIKGQIERIASQTNLFGLPFRAPNTNSIISDIYDGSLYKEIFSENKESFENKEAFTFTLNIDGISIAKKTKMSIWPILLSINELPMNTRFAIENTIVAGIK